ncbi:MAG: hypothetical protein PHX08_08870 [Lachnospiraceae bacterium]|nr:hypothetical protein [Lachnospiraceae bacterium]
MFGFDFMWAMCGNIFDKQISTDKKASLQNDYLFVIYFTKLVNYALSMFEWGNLPEEMKDQTRYMEMVLLFTGAGVMYEDDEFDKFDFLQMLPNGSFDRYGNQEEFTARGYNGYNKRLNQESGVVCWNNYTRSADMIPTIISFAERLADVQRTIDVRLEHHKVPVLFQGNKNNKFSLLNIFKKRQNHEPVVIVDEQLDYHNAVINITDPQFIVTDLWEYKKDLWNEAMLFLGVDNAKLDKKERMIEAEVRSNDEQIELGRDIMLNARRDFVKKANERWGLSMTVDFRNVQMRTKEKEAMMKEEFGGEYDDSTNNDTMV